MSFRTADRTASPRGDRDATGTLNTPGTLDGNATGGALFQEPTGIAIRGDGTIFVADNGAATLRAISPTGIVTTLAGVADQYAAVDGTAAGAEFAALNRITLDGKGGLYASDGNAIRYIDSSFRVTTLVGLANTGGYSDGSGSNALFFQPRGLRVAASGNVLIADLRNTAVREMTPTGAVSTLFGAPAEVGPDDGQGSQARFNNPEGVAVSVSGYVYVADTSNMTIRRIAPDGRVSIYAGTPGTSGYTDGPAKSALFALPAALAVDTDETLYVADYLNCAVRKITPTEPFRRLQPIQQARWVKRAIAHTTRNLSAAPLGLHSIRVRMSWSRIRTTTTS